MQKKRILTKGGNPCVLRYQKRQGKTLASVRHERTEKWSRVSLQRGKKDKQEFDDERKGRRTALSEGRENYNDHF